MLSHYERRELKLIEERLHAEEPELAGLLRRCAVPRRKWQRRRSITRFAWCSVAGAVLLAGAASGNFPLIFIGITSVVAVITMLISGRGDYG